jgi:retrograde regulation protein 2
VLPLYPIDTDLRDHYLTDVCSNAIRYSVSDLSSPTSRILPTVHVHRISISLYDAQFNPKTGERVPIPEHITRAVVAAMRRFQIVCADLGVPEDRIRIIATEATRTAINSAEFCEAIQTATGLEVEMLPKEEEGQVGALGIASSFSRVSGLVMDLGGGSTQITWLIANDGDIRTSPKGSFSFPYGAAAMTRKLEALKAGKSQEEADKAIAALRVEMKTAFRSAYDELEIPDHMAQAAKKEGGYQLYLSGGGFRGWGYLLLYESQTNGQHYPISIINGFWAAKPDFEDTEKLKKIARTAHKIFRVSDRRRSQVPAVAFLVNVLAESLHDVGGIKEARFCQGGVREGVLFQELPKHIRGQDPLEVATEPFARSSARGMGDLLLCSLPGMSGKLSFDNHKVYSKSPAASITVHVIRALANILFVHSDLAKESSSAAALYSTSTGILASCHGVSHKDRALLALMFEERFEGELPPREADYKASLAALLTDEEIWWTKYIGKVAMLIARLYPAGIMDEKKPRALIRSQWVAGLGKHGNKEGLELIFLIDRQEGRKYMLKEAMEELFEIIEKVGRKKNWVPGKEGWGMKIKVTVREKDLWKKMDDDDWVF